MKCMPGVSDAEERDQKVSSVQYNWLYWLIGLSFNKLALQGGRKMKQVVQTIKD